MVHSGITPIPSFLLFSCCCAGPLILTSLAVLRKDLSTRINLWVLLLLLCLADGKKVWRKAIINVWQSITPKISTKIAEPFVGGMAFILLRKEAYGKGIFIFDS